MRLTTLVFLFLVGFMADAIPDTFNPNAENWSVDGNFFLSVDDGALLFINGKNITKDKLTLHANDRLVVQLSNIANTPRHFLLLFATSDKQNIISFRAVHFKILTDPDAKDFKEDELTGLSHHAVPISDYDGTQEMPFKNNCQAMWGDHDKSTLGTIITGDMFSPAP